jgi:feruloyl esterase
VKWACALILTLGCIVEASADSDTQCRNLYRLTDLAYAVEPGRVVPAEGTVPRHCRVRAVVNRAIQVEVTMPTEGWNGRFMFSTVGGAAGTIGDVRSLLARGFAMASTDTGHEVAEGFDFMNQPEALLDYAYRGVHLATQFAKQAVHTYYDRDIDFAYLKGCSNGGRAALMEAVRFPTDYDGIIAGAPAFRFQEFVPWMTEVARYQTRGPLTEEALQVLDDASRAACDSLDGVVDGVISDPRRCTEDIYDVDQLACKVGQTQGCLTKGQIETARFIYSDQLDAFGNVVSPGVLPGAEAAGDWAMWMLPNDLLGSGDESIISDIGESLKVMLRRDPSFNLAKFDTSNDREMLDDMASYMDVQTADLSEFRARGGKLIMYQGWNDWPLRPQRAIDYLAAAEGANGGVAETGGFFRLFTVPGMVHCAQGPGAWLADYVDPLVTWRESDKAPETITALQPEQGFSRPLCVYPKLTKYKGRGDVNREQSFECK